MLVTRQFKRKPTWKSLV